MMVWVARVVQFGVLLGLYRLLVGSDEPAEWVVGVVVAAVGVGGSSVVSRQLPPWRLPVGRLVRLVGVIPRLLVESVRVSVSAVAREMPVGSFAVVPIDPGGDDGESSARRGLVIAGVSLAPNRLAVTLDRERGALLVHQLLPDSKSIGESDREWPI